MLSGSDCRLTTPDRWRREFEAGGLTAQDSRLSKEASMAAAVAWGRSMGNR